MSQATQTYLDSLDGPTETEVKELENLLLFTDDELNEMDRVADEIEWYDPEDFYYLEDEYPNDLE